MGIVLVLFGVGQNEMAGLHLLVPHCLLVSLHLVLEATHLSIFLPIRSLGPTHIHLAISNFKVIKCMEDLFILRLQSSCED